MRAAVRLQKYLSECGVDSRRKVLALIQEGKVRVNGHTICEPSHRVIPGADHVTVGRKAVVPQKKGVLIFHKPRGVVTTLNDPQGRSSLADFLPKKFSGYYPVGRLDYDSSGLIVLTNDGDLALRLSHPRYEVQRVYSVKATGVVSDQTIKRVERGVRLSDGFAQAKLKRIRGDDRNTWLQCTITEGRNRIIRRLLERVGHPVKKLHRESHGPVRIGKLRSGEIQELSEAQYEKLRAKVFPKNKK